MYEFGRGEFGKSHQLTLLLENLLNRKFRYGMCLTGLSTVFWFKIPNVEKTVKYLHINQGFFCLESK